MYIIYPESDDLEILYLTDEEYADGAWVDNHPNYRDDNYQIEVEADD